MRYRVTLIEGDGIGPEVTGAAARVLEAAGAPVEWERVVAGQAAFAEYGHPLPERVIDSLKANRVGLKGPLGTPKGGGFRSANVQLRQRLQLFTGWRPVRSLPGVASRYDDVDVVVLRENTEGLYAGIEHQVRDDTVVSLKLSSRVRGGADRAVGVRVRPQPRSAPHHRLPQEGGAAAGRRRVRRRVPRGRSGLPVHGPVGSEPRRGRDGPRPGPEPVRRAPPREPLRRHPVGPVRRSRGRPRGGARGQRRASRGALRGGPRHRARHRGPGDRQPPRGAALRLPHGRVHGRPRGGAAGARRDRRRSSRPGRCGRATSAGRRAPRSSRRRSSTRWRDVHEARGHSGPRRLSPHLPAGAAAPRARGRRHRVGRAERGRHVRRHAGECQAHRRWRWWVTSGGRARVCPPRCSCATSSACSRSTGRSGPSRASPAATTTSTSWWSARPQRTCTRTSSTRASPACSRASRSPPRRPVRASPATPSRWPAPRGVIASPWCTRPTS